MCSLLTLWEHYQAFPVLFCHFPAKYTTTWQNQEKIIWKIKPNGYSKLLLTKEVKRVRWVRGRTIQKHQFDTEDHRCGEIYSQVVVTITEMNLSVHAFDLWCTVPVISRSRSSGMCQEGCALLEHFTVTPQAFSFCSNMAFLVAPFPWRDKLWQETLYLWPLQERILNGWRG